VTPLSAIYGGVARFRRSWYERHPATRRRLTRPVISVGNLAVGGSGKTPIVAALARSLLDMGERPAVLSRGYARRITRDGVVVVSDGARVLVAVDESGDEPQMLANTLHGVPVLVSADRYLAGRLAVNRFGATVLLLDDGFQHLQLARTVDLLVVAPSDLTDEVLPSGRLREPLSAARCADAVLVYGDSDEAERVASRLGVASGFSVRVQYRGAELVGRGGAAVAAGARVVAVAGIARPRRFFAALGQQGYEVVREVAFRDHHWFTRADIRRMAALARDLNAAAIVTTEKDAVRLDPAATMLAAAWAVLPMEVFIEPAERFTSWLRTRLHSHTIPSDGYRRP
jgi:tetraacyldisaccharide 4'-kinase